jgi:L-rhamnose mutarotase
VPDSFKSKTIPSKEDTVSHSPGSIAKTDGSDELKRYAFMLKLRPGAAPAYEEAHSAVWPEMLALLKKAGISEYSIYRRDELLVLVLRAKDFEATWKQIENDPVNLRWQAAMKPYFTPVEGIRSGERFAMLDEVFYLP